MRQGENYAYDRDGRRHQQVKSSMSDGIQRCEMVMVLRLARRRRCRDESSVFFGQIIEKGRALKQYVA